MFSGWHWNSARKSTIRSAELKAKTGKDKGSERASCNYVIDTVLYVTLETPMNMCECYLR
jgi:hypothetical protein